MVKISANKSETIEVNLSNSCGRIYFVKDYDKGRLVRIHPFSKELGDSGKHMRLRDAGGGCAIVHMRTLCLLISKSLRNGASPEKLAREYLLGVQCERGNANLDCGYTSCEDALGWAILD